MDSLTQTIAILFILLVLVLNAINIVVRRRGPLPMRRIRAFDRLPGVVSASVEAAQPLHISLGSATIGGETTLLALAGAEVGYFAAREAAISDASPLVTVSDAAALPLAVDTLRRAYASRDMLERYRPVKARWYPAGPQSLAFAGALTALQAEDDPSANLLVGSFGAELALIAFAAQRYSHTTLAVSDQLSGQAAAYALATDVLIGEEAFAAPGYLSDDPKYANRNTTTDIMRYVLIGAIIVIAVFTLLNGT